MGGKILENLPVDHNQPIWTVSTPFDDLCAIKTASNWVFQTEVVYLCILVRFDQLLTKKTK